MEYIEAYTNIPVPSYYSLQHHIQGPWCTITLYPDVQSGLCTAEFSLEHNRRTVVGCGAVTSGQYYWS